MGLTIHYALHADTRSDHDARRAVQQLQQAAMDLPFVEVGAVIELTGDSLCVENAEDDQLRWLLVQASPWIRIGTGCSRVRPNHLIAFTAWPGPGCEVANIGLCRYPPTIESDGKTIATGIDGWYWKSFCKTQYASDPKDGGIRNFLRCHLTVIKLLDRARELNVLAEVKDEGGFWERRDVAMLAEAVGQWNQHVAAVVGRYKDWFHGAITAPITEYPDFEHLEADGQKANTKVPRTGDRIRLLSMRDDPDPIEAGQTGTVVGVARHADGRHIWHQIDVAWDNGRTLMLVSPPDRFEIVGGGSSNS